MNVSVCALPIFMMAITADPSTYNITNETQIGYVENSWIVVNTPIISGYNYIFFSIPVGKTLTIKDSIGIDITNQFTLQVAVDDRTGYKTNSIYKKNDMFGTSLSTQ